MPNTSSSPLVLLKSPSDNWVLRFNAMKRRLMAQYFSNLIGQPTKALEVPNLMAMAQDNDDPSN
jgi:hypothetical protein